MKYSYMYVYTRMIFAAVLSPAIKIFHRHLGPNLLIFAVKVSPWFHRHFTVILWHITDISPWKNTDQGDFLLKRAVRAVLARKPNLEKFLFIPTISFIILTCSRAMDKWVSAKTIKDQNYVNMWCFYMTENVKDLLIANSLYKQYPSLCLKSLSEIQKNHIP
jgi:hypothetical protein